MAECQCSSHHFLRQIWWSIVCSWCNVCAYPTLPRSTKDPDSIWCVCSSRGHHLTRCRCRTRCLFEKSWRHRDFLGQGTTAIVVDLVAKNVRVSWAIVVRVALWQVVEEDKEAAEMNAVWLETRLTRHLQLFLCWFSTYLVIRLLCFCIRCTISLLSERRQWAGAFCAMF